MKFASAKEMLDYIDDADGIKETLLTVAKELLTKKD